MTNMQSINILGSAATALNKLTELVENNSIRGKWIRSNPKCSICDAVLETDTKPNYCPNCGAKMDND